MDMRKWMILCLVWPGLALAQAPVAGPEIHMPDAAALAAEAPDLKLKNPLEGKLTLERSTIDDQTDVAVTVYNNDLALVREKRQVKMLPGEVSLQFMDVASGIKPETVHLVSLTAPGTLQILEQNYEFDLVSPAKLMEKYVGKEVRLINKNKDYDVYETAARLLSVNDGPVYEIDGDIYLGHPGDVVLPEMPENLIAKPTLVWVLDNKGTDHEVEVTYLTNGMSWKADYVLTLDKDWKQVDVAGWVTLMNQSGAPYRNAQLKLVAGAVNIAPEPKMMREDVMYRMAPAAAPPAPMQQEAFAEYHLYTLSRRTTIKENQSKQVSLLTADAVPVRRVYELRGQEYYAMQPMQDMEPQHVAVLLKFKNEEANHLGMPLPGGIMRVYQADSSGMLQFAGEDQIQHTPKDEEVKLKLGEAFDVVAERTQTNFEQLMDRLFSSSCKIVVRNHKKEAIEVEIIEPFTGDWTIEESSMPHEKRDSRTALFKVAVPEGGEATVTYRVRIKR